MYELNSNFIPQIKLRCNFGFVIHTKMYFIPGNEEALCNADRDEGGGQ